jgi:hypothetical protein
VKPIDIFLNVSAIGGRLGILGGDKIRMLLPANCPPELKDAIRQHKPALMELLRLNFLVVKSDTLKAIVFWAPDALTKQALVSAGADAGSIYTALELEQLVKWRATADELLSLHAAKQRLGGNLRPPQ